MCCGWVQPLFRPSINILAGSSSRVRYLSCNYNRDNVWDSSQESQSTPVRAWLVSERNVWKCWTWKWRECGLVPAFQYAQVIYLHQLLLNSILKVSVSQILSLKFSTIQKLAFKSVASISVRPFWRMTWSELCVGSAELKIRVIEQRFWKEYKANPKRDALSYTVALFLWHDPTIFWTVHGTVISADVSRDSDFFMIH